MASNDFRQQLRNIAKLKEQAIFWISFLAIIFLAPYLLNILKRIWELREGKIYLVGQFLLSIDPMSISVFVNFILGLYLGLFLLILVDEKKRINGVLLFVLILYMFVNILLGNLFPHVEWGGFQLWLAGGFLIGLAIGGAGDIFKGRLEFKRASKYLAYISIAIIFITLFTFYFDLFTLNIPFSKLDLIKDIVISLIFTWFFKSFLEYEFKSSKVFIVGPPSSGKTTLTLGLYFKALEKTGSKPIEPSKQLKNLVKEFKQTVMKNEWPKETRNEAFYQFTFRSGTLFPKETVVSTIDYPGGYLSGIARAMEQKTEIKEKDSAIINIQNAVEENSEKVTYNKIAEKIIESDKLVLVVDGMKKFNPTEIGINDFTEILRIINKRGKFVNYYIVITKCDIFEEEFEKLTSKIPDSTTYAEYRDYIIKKFQDIEEIRLLSAETYGAEFYPVFYPTIEIESGYRTVLLGNDGNLLATFGFDKLLEELV